MTKGILIAFIILTFGIAKGQAIDTVRFINKADSILISKVGQEVFRKHLKLDGDGIAHTDTFKIAVWYEFDIKKYDCQAFYLPVIFDSNFVFIKDLDLAFVPDYLIKNQKCNFISKSEVRKTLSRIKRTKNLTDWTLELMYNLEDRKYVWKATLPISSTDRIYTTQAVQIDAVTGKILENKTLEQVRFNTNAI